jgi:uncharacterized membrane protein
MYAVMSIAGTLLLLSGGFIFTSSKVKTISGLCFGFGSALLVLGIGKLLNSFIVSATESERINRLKSIEVNDERNTRIREKAGYMTSRIMNYLISVLILALGIMNVDITILIMVASLLLAEFVLVIVFSNHYSKKI